MSLTDRRRNDTKDRIIDNSASLFATKGYNNTSISEIERLSGLKPGSGGLYRHFTSKSEILLEVVNQYHIRIVGLRNKLKGNYSGDIEADAKFILNELITFMSSEHNMLAITGDTNGIPGLVRTAISDTWNDGYGIFVDLFCAYGFDDEAAKLAGVLTLGAISHFVFHLANWHATPLELGFNSFIDYWGKQAILLLNEFNSK